MMSLMGSYSYKGMNRGLNSRIILPFHAGQACRAENRLSCWAGAPPSEFCVTFLLVGKWIKGVPVPIPSGSGEYRRRKTSGTFAPREKVPCRRAPALFGLCPSIQNWTNT
jgi:hypothetical protein